MFHNSLFNVPKIWLQLHLLQWAGVGETQFHVALSTGAVPLGPTHKVVSVKVEGKKTRLSARKEFLTEALDGERILQDIYDLVTLKYFEGYRTYI